MGGIAKLQISCPQCNLYIPVIVPIEKHTSYGQCGCGIRIEALLDENLFIDFKIGDEE